ncbi:MAG: Flp pilus assembly complex ATPase component TadA [Gammaproteobacteria bacterium]|nr:Flp pilus assembly complex ATPase component TadA [Gammaproteobacteria bacterium]
MEYKVLTTADDLPTTDRLVIDDQLTDQERQNFCFAESKDGRVYCLINQQASTVLRQRAQTIKDFGLEAREITTLYVTNELLFIFRDRMSHDVSMVVESESELDRRFSEILLQAVRARASDIHLEIYADRAEIKFRIHGLIYKIGELDTRTVNRLINYVYNVAAAEGSKDTQYNPEEMQDALLDMNLDIDGIKRHYKLRLQTAPCYPNSVTIVMRLLPVDTQLKISLNELGYNPYQIALLERAQARPVGVTIVAGTTGSGKSTTLATILSEVFRRTKGSKKILTTEDPPEYTIPGANQINLSIKRSETSEDENVFVKAIRVAMRCDPDIIMVGEVRDQRSSQLLSSAVLSGHQVFTTVHAASAIAIYNRLLNLGFEGHVLSAPNFLALLIYQTLVPTSCSKCSLPYEVFLKSCDDPDALATIDRLKKVMAKEENQHCSLDTVRFVNAEGCESCRKGIAGRTVLAEMLDPTPDILVALRDLDFSRATQIWRSQGGRTVLEHGIDKIFAGIADPRYVEDSCGLLSDPLEEVGYVKT